MINMLGALWSAPVFLCTSHISGCRKNTVQKREQLGECSQMADKCTLHKDVRRERTSVKLPMSRIDKKGQIFI